MKKVRAMLAARNLISLLALICSPLELKAEIEIPALTGPVIDDARMLSPAERDSIEQLARSHLATLQLQVWTVRSLEGEPIENLSIRAAEKWKLGTEKSDNGVLVLVASADRKIRIEVGQGLEGNIPDVFASRLIREVVVPRFKSGDYGGGILAVSERLVRLASGGEEPPSPRPSSRRREAPQTSLSFLLPLLLFSIIRALERLGLLRSRSGFRRRGFGGGGWGGGGGFGGGFGGGSWGGGGGGFSGGGSSGSWSPQAGG